MARLLRLLSCLLLLELGSEAKSEPAPSAKGKFPFAGGKVPDLSKLKGSNPRRRDAKKPGGKFANIGNFKPRGKNQKTQEERAAKLRELAEKRKAKTSDSSKRWGKGNGKTSDSSKKGKAPDLSKWGKDNLKTSDSRSSWGKGTGKPSNPSKQGKASDLSKWRRNKNLPDLSKRRNNAAGKGKDGKPWQKQQNNRTKEFIEKQFKVMDSNQDGQVTSDELTEVVAALRKRAEETGVDLTPSKQGHPNFSRKAWKGFDPVESSLLQKTEVNNPEKNGAPGWFKTVDENGDGTLTLPEFETRMKSKMNPFGSKPRGKGTEL